MKVRQGFVSNSSSSSFIVAFPKDFEITSDNVRQYLFGNQEDVFAYHGVFSTEHVADQVTRDMLAQTPNDEDVIKENLGGHDPDGPDLYEFKRKREGSPGYEYDWDAYTKASDEHRQKVFDRLKTEHADMNLFVFEYSDNDGDFFCTMEHGGIFNKVPGIRISNH